MRLNFLVILLYIAVSCFAADPVSRLYTGQSIYTGLPITSVAASTPANTNYFFQETFEGAGYQNTWTPGGNTPYADPDATNVVMQGTNNCSVGSAATFTYTASEFTAKAEVWGKFMVNKSDIGSGQNNSAKLTLSRTGVANDLEIAFQAGGIIGVKHGTVTVTGAYTMGEGTNYYVWFHYSKGTGANGVAEVYVNTSDSKPGSAEIFINNGDAAQSPSAVSLQSTAELSYFDDIKLSESDFQ